MKYQSDFEVGQKYQYININSTHFGGDWFCIGFSPQDKRAILESKNSNLLIHVIEPGFWEKIQEPREFWILDEGYYAKNAYPTPEDAAHARAERGGGEIIHVREVTEE